jgi:hypothetical protein
MFAFPFRHFNCSGLAPSDHGAHRDRAPFSGSLDAQKTPGRPSLTDRIQSSIIQTGFEATGGARMLNYADKVHIRREHCDLIEKS